jgi:putative cardiolipin synthase
VSERTESFAIRDTAETHFGKMVTQLQADQPGKSGFHLLESGLDAFVARAVLASYAERSIDAQYYLWHTDLVGRLFLELLMKAADRGVRVRLLVDDMTLTGRDIGAVAIDAHPNIELRIFNPFSRKRGRLLQLLTRFGSVTRRMHNKSFTVDNQFTIVGGRNIGNEYFEADPDLAFGDLDVLAIGPVVDEVSTAFDLYWNAAVAYPAASLIEKRPDEEHIMHMRQTLIDLVAQQHGSAYLESLHNSSLANILREGTLTFDWGRAHVLYDDPEKITAHRNRKELQLVTQLSPHMDEIRDELIVFSPYFVPGEEGVAALLELRDRGVRVRILTNSLASTDVSVVHAGYSRYRKVLLRAGVELFEMNKMLTRKQRREKKGPGGSSKASLHAKSFVLDSDRVFIGSLNLDPRSVVENTEIGVVIESGDIAVAMNEWFEREIPHMALRLELDGRRKLVWHGSEEDAATVYTTEPHTSFWRRFGVGCLRLLPIESQL